MKPAIRPALIAAVLVWLTAETVLQIHGLCFWAEHGGWQGWLWSLALGVVSVWFWLHRSPAVRWIFGSLASLLLLLGPLWQVGSPLIADIEARSAQQTAAALRCELLRNTEAELTATLHTYLRNSETRSGWAPELARVRAELSSARAERAALAVTPPAVRLAWLSAAVIIIQIVALVVLQVAAVIALTAIRIALAPADHKSPAAYASLDPTRPSQFDTFVAGEVNTARFSAMAAIPAPPKKRNTDTTAIRQRIAAGHYGTTPTIRRVMEAEGRRYQVVGPIFKDLVASGLLRQEGTTYRVVA